MYHKRLVDKGYDLERGIKGSDNQNINIKQYKQMTKKLNHSLNVRNKKFDSAMSELEENMKSNKNTIFDKEYVKVKKDTFDSMNNVIHESKKVMELQPKLQSIFNEADSYENSYKSLEKENQKYKKEVNILEKENKELRQENNSLIYRLNYLFELLKIFLRKLLQRGNDYTKNESTEIVKECYDENEFDMNDVVRISRGTTKQDELFEYVEAPDYLKSRIKYYDKYAKDKSNYEISL